MPGSSTIQFTLLENAVDSLERAVDILAWEEIPDESSRLKQAILLTAHATELLLKERLRRIHPSLVWEDVDKYPRLDARTVGVDKAVHRLKQIGNIVLSEADAAMVKALRNTRNAIEHFHWQTSRDEATGIIGKGLSFALHFAREELQTDLAYRFRRDDTWAVLLTQNQAFASAHGARAERELAQQGRQVQECSFCNAMAQDIVTGACALCGHWEPLGDDEAAPF